MGVRREFFLLLLTPHFDSELCSFARPAFPDVSVWSKNLMNESIYIYISISLSVCLSKGHSLGLAHKVKCEILIFIMVLLYPNVDYVQIIEVTMACFS